ncbi:hypothetical protein [Lentibacillus sp. CBA3610]|uniref:hypothetical protein n=1 Tax=Lentibacillus sp. CBA3610 TaxID=2518176 RepID=UPI001596331B|nr:hypothetical protein [Lentibacillus sp. CBA3610]QKY70633.1 hypothetical protein Len3610_14470 [Lentibacillus sp. CBA3610]
MQKTRKNTVLKAIGLSLLFTIIAFLVVDNPKPNTAVYLLVVGIASFAAVCVISLITSRAYKKFLKES